MAYDTKENMISEDILLSTTDSVPGREYEILGVVQGTTIETRNIGRDLTQSFRSLAGGELPAYVEMMVKARSVATERMIEQARARGADAVIAMRYTTNSIAAGAAEVLAFGTAVKFRRSGGSAPGGSPRPGAGGCQSSASFSAACFVEGAKITAGQLP